MPKNLFFSNWPINTLRTTANDSLQQKLSKLALAVDEAEQFLTSTAARINAEDPIYVFTVPEYYFVKGISTTHNGELWELYDENEKDSIYTGLKQISAAYKKIIIFPGTVYWKTPRQTPTGRNNARIFDGISVAPVLYKGSVQFEYEKKFDDGSCRENTTDVAFRAGNGEQTFKLQGVRFGIEVCGDFEESRLANATTTRLDVEIYMSATNPHAFNDSFMTRIPIRDGGYLVHCDASGEVARNGVWLINRGGGSHGMALDIGSNHTTLYDPFTCKPIPLGHKLLGDYAVHGLTGEALAVSKVFKVSLGAVRGHVLLPPKPKSSKEGTQLMSGNYALRISAIAPQKITDTGFRAKLTVEVTGSDDDKQLLSGAAIQLQCPQGLVAPMQGQTDAKGQFTAKLNVVGPGPATVTASWKGARNSATIELLNLGMGNVSKMGKLQGNPNDELPSWHVLL